MPLAIPHLALPFTIDPIQGAATVAQDSLDDVAQCVAVLCGTDIGDRVSLPIYGIEDQLFAQSIATAPIVSAITTWEPRANISVLAGPGPNAVITVNVGVNSSSSTTAIALSAGPAAGGQAPPIPAPVPVPTGPVIYDGGNSSPLLVEILDGQITSPNVLSDGEPDDDGEPGTSSVSVLDGGGAAPVGTSLVIDGGSAGSVPDGSYDGGSASPVPFVFLDGGSVEGSVEVVDGGDASSSPDGSYDGGDA